MFNLFRKKADAATPAWFPSSAADFTVFIGIIDDVKKDKLPGYSFSEDKSSLVAFGADGKESGRINLNNIAGICLNASKAEWKDLISKFFISLTREPAGDKYSFDEIKPFLFVQTYPKDIIEQKKIPLLFKEIIPETIIVLMLDTPERIESVKLETLEKWGKTVDEVFRLALENTKKLAAKLLFGDIGNGSKVQVGESENVFTASTALFLEQIKKAGDKGLVFSIPNRHTVITLPITDVGSFANDLTFFAMFTARVFAEAQYPITSNIYWLRNGIYTKLIYNFENKKFNFYPPEEFVEVLS